MKDNSITISNYFYRGMEIFSIMRNRILRIDGEIVNLYDKKILALYLGLTYTEEEFKFIMKNYFTNSLKESERLTKNLEIYANDYVEIVNEIKNYLTSLEDYKNYLQQTEIVSKYLKGENNIAEIKSNKQKILTK